MLDYKGLVYEPAKEQKCGCYVVNPEIRDMAKGRNVLVPLKHIEYGIEIVNSLVSISLAQKYANTTNTFLELEYSFPVNPNACVYKFVAVFGDTRIEGVVKEKEEAKVDYTKAVSEGRRAAYGDINAESRDIMKLKIGNVAPQTEVRIEISLLQQLSLSCNTFYRLQIMGAISPRYMNHVPEQQMIAAFKKVSHSQIGEFFWNFKLRVKSTRKIVHFGSPSHKLFQTDEKDPSQLSLTMTEGSVPNKDFLFLYTTEDFHLPSFVLGRTDVSSTAMISFIPKFCQLKVDDAYKAAMGGTPIESDIESARGEYIFLLDRSGSMEGQRISQATAALTLFIRSLPTDSFFNVVSFGGDYKKLFDESEKYSNTTVVAAIDKVKKMGADMGGTEIYAPLLQVLTQKPIDGYPKQVFLLTDGGVSNTANVLRMIATNTKYARVHCIGIGNGASANLIVEGAVKGKGSHIFISDNENPAQKIIQLLTDSLSPVISKLRLAFDESIVESVIPNPKSMPYILKNQAVNFYVTFKGQLNKAAEFSFEYEDSQNRFPFQAKVTVGSEDSNESFVDKMAQFKRIKQLQDAQESGSSIEDLMYYVKVVDRKQEIIKLSVKHQILSKHTAFVCVEKLLIDGKYQQIKAIGTTNVTIQQPTPLQHTSSTGCYLALPMPPIPIPSSQFSIIGNASQQKQFCTITKASSLAPPPPPPPPPTKSSDGFFSTLQNLFGFGMTSPPPPQSLIQSTQSSHYDAYITSSSAAQKDSKKKQKIKQQSSPIEMALNSLSMNQDMFCNMEQQQMEYKQMDQKQVQKKQMKLQHTSSINLEDVLSQQSIDGSWNNFALLSKLFPNFPQLQGSVQAEPNAIALLTYLIAKWIQHNHPGKQYALVIKKAIKFATTVTEEQINKFSQYIP